MPKLLKADRITQTLVTIKGKYLDILWYFPRTTLYNIYNDGPASLGKKINYEYVLAYSGEEIWKQFT